MTNKPVIRLRNSMTRKTEDFTPIDENNVRMYLCGPTVYDRAHLGNARNVIMFDVLFRLLREVYGADHVTYVRNFTDVDDKINARAAQSGRSISDITEETIGWYHADMGALGNLPPTHEPRATQYIGEMITMIEDLIAKGHAYVAEGHVLFDVRSYAEYGKLSGRSVDDMIAGARVEVAPYKRDPMDFVLWKPSGDDLPGWDSPWGRGRPGWHIECSAMAEELLWKQPKAKGKLSENALHHPHTFDIHGGGNDLMFPHHENEVAQSCCAHPDGGFARVWMHNEMLQVEGKKMSKSLGNFFTVRDLLDQGVPDEVIRFVFLSTHYGKPMDWTQKKAEDAEKTLLTWKQIVDRERDLVTREFTANTPPKEIVEALADDLNTSLALTRTGQLAKQAKASGGAKCVELAEALHFLGFEHDKDWSVSYGYSLEKTLGEPVNLEDYETVLFNEWKTAKKSKDFSKVDELKAMLVAAGVEIRMNQDGVTLEFSKDFDPSKLEALK